VKWQVLHFTSANDQLKDDAMNPYHPLTQEQRYLINAEMKTDKNLGQIALDVGGSRQTLWRERKRNKGLRGYRPPQAQRLAEARRHSLTQPITAFGLAFIHHKLSLGFSPEQIHGGLTAIGWQAVPSHEWLYQHIYRDKAQGGTLHTHLRCQKTYRKRHLIGQDRRGHSAGRVSIHERPGCIDARSRIGDIEGDTIIGRHHKGAVLTWVERKSL
jgi:transposase, IS30 family